jgi:hypothetical protein
MQTPSPKSPPELRQMGVGQLIDASIRLYLRHWKTFIAISALFMVPLAALSALSQAFLFKRVGVTPFSEPEAVPTFEDFAGAVGPLMVVGLLSLLITPLLVGALAWAASKIYLGEAPGIGEIVNFTFSRFGPLLLVSVLAGLAVAGGFLLLIIPGIIFYLRLAFSAIALVVEDKRGRRALGRSWALSKGSLGKVFGVVLLIFLISAIVQAIIGLPFGAAGAFFLSQGGVGSGSFLGFVGDALAGTLVTPFSTIALVLLYFDLRIRKEAFDLTLMAQEIGQQSG